MGTQPEMVGCTRAAVPPPVLVPPPPYQFHGSLLGGIWTGNVMELGVELEEGLEEVDDCCSGKCSSTQMAGVFQSWTGVDRILGAECAPFQRTCVVKRLLSRRCIRRISCCLLWLGSGW